VPFCFACRAFSEHDPLALLIKCSPRSYVCKRFLPGSLSSFNPAVQDHSSRPASHSYLCVIPTSPSASHPRRTSRRSFSVFPRAFLWAFPWEVRRNGLRPLVPVVLIGCVVPAPIYPLSLGPVLSAVPPSDEAFPLAEKVHPCTR